MRSRGCRLAVCIFILGTIGLLAPARAQDNPDGSARSKILALEHAWNQAEAFHDVKSLDSLFDNALVYVDADGSLFTKAAFLEHARSAHLQQVVTQSMSVQIHGDTAIVTGVYQATSFENARLVTRRGRFVDTWVYKNSTWVCVAAQATPIVH